MLKVQADVFGDGHDMIVAALLYRASRAAAPAARAGCGRLYNDRWEASFTVDQIGQYQYTIQGWVDHFGSWHRDLKKRVEAGQNIAIDLLAGAQLVAETAERAGGRDREVLADWAAQVTPSGASPAGTIAIDTLEPLAAIVALHPDLRHATTFEPELAITVDRKRAEFSTWYELFPRSTSPTPGKHGTLTDCIARLPYVAEMGFDVLYLPPIHPIGKTFRKGRNNALTTAPGEPGSPWAIGSAEGGHKAILSDLGTLADFERLIAAARRHDMEIALDIAFQCSPDHPYVQEHPEWFRHRPDGSIQYAENPPKKYQDIYPFDFESADWQGLWQELYDVFVCWIERGVKIFRVDNPHTKAFSFWQWCIAGIKQQYPDVLFLSEAFTRPKLMYRLAKLGFSQSYTYFTWRYGKQEFTEYLTELTETAPRDFMRPNFWPNTPDILPEHLHSGQSCRLRGPLSPGGHAQLEHRHLRPRLRIAGAHATRAGERRISRFGKIRDSDLGSPAARQPARVHHQGESGAQAKSCPAIDEQYPLPFGLERSLALLQQILWRSAQRDRGRGQSRFRPRSRGVGRLAARRVGPGRQSIGSHAGFARWRDVHLASPR